MWQLIKRAGVALIMIAPLAMTTQAQDLVPEARYAGISVAGTRATVTQLGNSWC